MRGSKRPEGSWRVQRSPRSTEGIFRGPEAVMSWSWGVIIFLGFQGVLRNPVGLEGLINYGVWWVNIFSERPIMTKLWGLMVQYIFWKAHHDPIGPFRSSQNPFDPWWLLMVPYKPFNPSVTLHTHQPHLTLMTPKDPSGTIRTTSWLLQVLWISPQFSWEPLEPFRTHQDLSGPLSPSWSHITILLTC